MLMTVDPQLIPSGDDMILRWAAEEGYGDSIPPGLWVYLEFEALVTECGDFTNIANATGYYDCCNTVSAEDSADVWVLCEEPCEIYATVTSPYFDEEIDGEESLVITGTAYNDCTCPEIGNVSLALYYTQDDDNQNPTLYWNGTSGQWEATTIIYNPVEWVSGGCPETTLYWTRTVPVPPSFDDNSTYYIHVVAQPEDQNAGVVTSQFTAYNDE